MNTHKVACFFAFIISIAPMAHAALHEQSPSRMGSPPPMGWNSWLHFGSNATDADIRAQAKAMVSSGMKAAGYTYINIDDSWEGERDSHGNIQPNKRFPNMKALAAYVHSLGLKFGIYSSPGPKTCAGYLGSYDHVAQDARTYAKWGVDYLKYDLCSYGNIMSTQAPNNQDKQMAMLRSAYAEMGRALRATGRNIVFFICEYGIDSPWRWAPRVGATLWRTTNDPEPTWNRIYTIGEAQVGLERYAGPGHWNQPGTLEIGNGDLTLDEDRAQFTWWALMAAPLIAGNDLVTMTPAVQKILTNRAVIAVDQDPMGAEGKYVYTEDEMEVWVRHLQGGALAIAVFNLGAGQNIPAFHLNFRRLGLHGPQSARDLWSGKNISLSERTPIAMLSHGVFAVRIAHPDY